MGREQYIVPLRLVGGTERQAGAHGNNAAWNCSCSRELPLVGPSADPIEPGVNNLIECPDCAARFHVVGEGAQGKRVREVRQL